MLDIKLFLSILGPIQNLVNIWDCNGVSGEKIEYRTYLGQ